MDSLIGSDNKNMTLNDVVPSNSLDLDTFILLKNSLLDLDEKERKIFNHRETNFKNHF